jgi:uncharacterized membrane protein (DUF485 family)
VCEIALRDSLVLSAVQTVLRMILRILPPIFIMGIFPISYVIRVAFRNVWVYLPLLRLDYNTARTVGMVCFVLDFIFHYVFVFRASKSTFMFIWISILRIDLKPVRSSSARLGCILVRMYGALNVCCTLRMRFCASYISSFKTLFSILGYIMLSF